MSYLAVLSHLESRDCHTTGVGSLTRGVPDGTVALLLADSLEDVDGLLGATHVGTLSDEEAVVGDQSLSLLLADLVLGSARQGNVDLADVDPGAGTGDVLEASLVLVGSQRLASELDVGNLLNVLGGEAGIALGDESTLGVGERDNGGAELNTLEGGVLGDVAGTRDGDALASPASLAGVLQHVADVVDETVTGGLGTDQAATPGAALAGQDTLPSVALAAVGTKHVADLTATDTNITGGHVSVGANVLGELSHERLAESADLVVTLALGVEVGTTLATTNVEASQSILEDLLETQELEAIIR